MLVKGREFGIVFKTRHLWEQKEELLTKGLVFFLTKKSRLYIIMWQFACNHYTSNPSNIFTTNIFFEIILFIEIGTGGQINTVLQHI